MGGPLINWRPSNLPPGAMPWSRQIQNQIQAILDNTNRNQGNTDLSLGSNNSTMQQLSVQIGNIETQQASLAAAQAQITSNLAYTNQLAQVYANGSGVTQSGVTVNTWSTLSTIRVSVTVPILTGRVRVVMSGAIISGYLTFSCAAEGITQATALAGGPNNIYTSLSTNGSNQVNASRESYVGGLTIGATRTFILEFYSSSTSLSSIWYPSISVQNIGLD